MEAASPKKSGKKKRKTRTTKSYKKREKEVQNLLKDTQYRASSQEEYDEEALSIQFFHGTEEEIQKEKEAFQEAAEVESDEDSGGELPAPSSDSPSHTFVHIDLQDPPLVWHQLFKQKHYYDESLLYRPSNTPHFQLNLNDSQLKSSQIRMLNRYQEQAKSGSSKLSSSLISQLADVSPPNFHLDRNLYRSVCHRKFQSVFFEPMPRDQFQGLPTRRCLKLSLSRLRFSLHHKLLEEHQLTQQLEDLYDVYSQQRKLRICRKLREELEIARQVATRLLASADLEQTSEVKRQLRLTQQLRQRYYSESAAERNLLKRLLHEWAHLKELRRQQRFQCTRFQLSLRVVHPPDLEASYSAWKESFESDLAEVYREHLELFYCRRRLWSEQNSSLKSAPHSKPPRKPKFEKIMASLRKEYEKAFRDPEEPFVEVIRLHADEASAKISIPGSEQQPRARNYFLKIFLDGQIVGQTRSYRLEPDLQICINECFGVLLERTMPENLHVWIYEKSTLTPNSRRLAQMSTPLAMSSKDSAVHEKLSFQTSTSSSPRLAGDVYLHYDYRSTDGSGGAHSLDDVQRLPEALRQTLIPPKLAPMPEASKELVTPRPPSGKTKKSLLPPLTFAEQQLQFCAMEVLLENRRFQLLHSRHQQRNLHTKQLRFVPALEHEITDAEALPDSRGTGQLLEPGTYWNPIDLHKHRGRKFLQLLYEVIASQSARRAKALQTPLPLLLLAEDSDHSSGWTAVWRALGSVFQGQTESIPREPLTWSAHHSGQDLFQHFAITLHVVRATGVPVRSRHILNLNERRTSAGGDISTSLFVTQTLMYSNVRPFVTLSYGQRLCRSRTAEGSNPTWNEQLQLQVNSQFGDLRDDLKISLFDEVIEQQYSDEASDLYQRVQCNWLGEFRVPINSLLACRKFEGCMELVMPKVLVGYKRPLIDSVTNMASDQYPEFKESVHMWFYLSIEPGGADIPPLQSNALACAEKPELQIYLRERKLELLQLLPQPQRYVGPLVCTAQGKRVCLTRLLEPVPVPPAVTTSGENPLEGACRFVSLLSQLRTYDACQGFRGVWLDNQTLLDSTWCSVKDLGVLLCNYLLSLGLECWLILGVACPHGECSFVLYRQPETAELFLVAPASGKRYQLQDVHCPLRRVFCLVGRQNIYFNIQTETRVSMTNFNLQDGACWFPLFVRRISAPNGGVQKLDYMYKRSYELTQLQKHIERKIMKKISVWRATRKTIWNRAFQPRLQKILCDMEALATYSRGQYDEPAFNEQLEREYPNYRLYGFTLNFAYTNLAGISERIRTTCIHYNNHTDVEFCVAVHLHSHSNDVLSVWLFLLSVVPLGV
ncbi:hypothetical protein KR009_000826 [Drosophila setifemur]|nr:hypothetical protein KR009_000826 [Drosophila setifemur]